MKNILIVCCILTLICVSSFSQAHVSTTANNTEDHDKDGMPDWWENYFSDGRSEKLDTARDDSGEDPDGDSLLNIDEFRYGTHPFEKDTDEDSIDDGEEIHHYKTNPAIADTDGGGRSDGYEVMNGADPLSAGDDHSPVITVSVSLEPGWNLISFPVSPPDILINEILSPISGSYSAVWSYRNGKWKLYDPANPGLSDLTTMEAGWGYWINMKYSEILTVSGSTAPKSVDLEDGWNLVGYNLPNSQPVKNVLSSINGKYLSVWVFINGAWKAYDPLHPEFSDLAMMEPGYGYWINAGTRVCTWILP